MKRRTTIAALALALALALLSNARPGSAQTGDRALSPEEIRALVARVVANQRRNDAALEQYERVERRQLRKSQSGTSRAEDKTFRVVPTGSGTERVQIEERGQPVDAEFYRGQLRNVEQALLGSLNPAEARQSQRVANAAKRSREHAEMLDAVGNAFRFTWLGREARNGRTLVKLHLEPNPDYKPASRITSLLGAVRATAWLDEAAGQMVRIEAELARDIPFGGGLLGKAYRGASLVMEQAEIAPGVWLPTRFDYNLTGRKFLFSFEVHELTEASHYRRIGPPREALLLIRRELGGTAASRSNR